jgi:hypothetical protein
MEGTCRMSGMEAQGSFEEAEFMAEKKTTQRTLQSVKRTGSGVSRPALPVTRREGVAFSGRAHR